MMHCFPDVKPCVACLYLFLMRISTTQLRTAGASVHFSYKHHLGDEEGSSSGAGLEDDQLSLPTGGIFRAKTGQNDGSDLSPFYSIDSTHLDFNFTQEINNSDRRNRPDNSSAQTVTINGDLYSQVVDT